jgi:hypothetical protein
VPRPALRAAVGSAERLEPSAGRQPRVQEGSLCRAGLVFGSFRSVARRVAAVGAFPVCGRGATRGSCQPNRLATETKVNIGQNFRLRAVYQIVARPEEVKFSVNGILVATHRDNFPAVPLNIWFSTGESCLGNGPVFVDRVTFQRGW